MNDRRELLPYLGLVIIIWAYVLMRAWLVPMVHDECASVLWYVQPGKWLPGQAHLDTNNHLTNSAIGVLSAKLFGVHPFSVRIGSVLAFLVYAWGIWHIGSRVKDRVVRWCLWCALLLIPFVLDFFSMFRGYAPEMAAWILGLEMMIRFAATGAARHLIAALLCLVMATVSMVVLLPTLAVGLAVLGLLQLRSWGAIDKRERFRRAAYLLLLGALPLLLLVRWILEFKEHGMLVYGGNDSFLQVTVRSMLLLLTGSDALWLCWSVVGLVGVCAIAAVLAFWRTRDWSAPLVLLTCFLILEVGLRVMMAATTGSNYPPDRTGMHYVPWALCCLALTIDDLVSRGWGWIRWAALPMLAFPLRTITTANLDHVLIWPEQCIPEKLVRRVLQEQADLGRPVVLGSHEQLKQCWLYAARQADLTAPFIQWERFPEGFDDLRLIDRRVVEGAAEGFELVDSATGPGLYLFRRKAPLLEHRILEFSKPPRSGRDEFYDLVDIPDSFMREALLVQLEVPVTMLERSPGLGVVVEITDTLQNNLYYDNLPLSAQRLEWRGDTLRFARSLPPFPSAGRAKIYLFNAERAGIELGAVQGAIGAIGR